MKKANGQIIAVNEVGVYLLVISKHVWIDLCLLVVPGICVDGVVLLSSSRMRVAGCKHLFVREAGGFR